MKEWFEIDMATGKTIARRWFVSSGPDSRHLQDVQVFTSAGAARAAYEASVAPAKEFSSMDFEPWVGGKNKRVIKEQVR